MWVALFVFIGKLAGAAKEMAIAWRYGVSETVDAYVFVFNLINLPVSVWFSVLTVVLAPLAARIRHDNPAELPRFRDELLGLTMIVGLGLGCLAWFGLPSSCGPTGSASPIRHWPRRSTWRPTWRCLLRWGVDQ